MIDKAKKYKNKGGLSVEILCTDIVSIYNIGALVTRPDGTQYVCQYCEEQLVEVNPYEDFKVDQPVMVRNDPDQQWYRRYFAGVSENGFPMTFADGMTSWSSHGRGKVGWTECKLPSEV
jgi:hypothetical protein